MDYRLCFMHGVRQTRRLYAWPVRKEIQRVEVLPDGVALYEVRSGTYRGLYYHPCVNLETGEMDCHCKDFDIRHVPAAMSQGRTIDLSTPKYWCKHLKLIVLDMVARGEAGVVMRHG